MDLSHLIALSNRYSTDLEAISSHPPHLTLYCRDRKSEMEAVVYEPLVCLILQGSKVTSIGDAHVDLHPGDALLVSHDLPVISQITKASRAEPYIALILTLDLGIVRSLYDQVAEPDLPHAEPRTLSTWRADTSWLEPLTRYVELVDHPLDAKVLGPSILREIHYRLLLSPIGVMLRRLLIPNSHANRIAKAIQMLRNNFRATISVAELAKCAGMGPSSFHMHFRSITGTTPLRYQKDLRFIDARMLLLDRGLSVSEAAYAVGYESPTQFSREYSKKFGVPPSRDA